MDTVPAHAPIRLARPSRDLETAERFWVDGVGLEVLWRSGAPVEGGHRLTMLGHPDAAWHLELVDDPVSAAAHPPGPEDLLVLYLGEPASPAWLSRIEGAGGVRRRAHNPYWDRWGVTFSDPDGYSLVLSHRTWSTTS